MTLFVLTLLGGCAVENIEEIRISYDQCFPALHAGNKVRGSAMLNYIPGIGSSIGNRKCQKQNIDISAYDNNAAALQAAYNKKFGDEHTFKPYYGEIRLNGTVENGPTGMYILIETVDVK